MMLKKCISVFLALIMLFSVFTVIPFPAYAATSGTTGDCIWSRDGTVLTISGSGRMEDYSRPDFGPELPWGTNITEVIIKDGVTNIGNYAFYSCRKLTSITIPYSVTSIGEYSFMFCSKLTDIHIPESVETIGQGAFMGCSGFTSLDIPDSVTAISSYCFQSCTGLTDFNIHDTVETIGNSAFNNCSALTEISVPDSVTSIGDSAFYHCTSLTRIDIGNSVESFGERAFYDCSALKELVVPASVTSIGIYTFIDCSGLMSIEVDEDNPVYDSRDECNAIIQTSSNYLLTGCSSTVIPETVTTIGTSAFNGCTNLTYINIPDSVTMIGESAFYRCANLTDLIIPYSVNVIGRYAFGSCNSLSYLDISGSAASLGDYVFSDCTGLTGVRLSDNVKTIGNSMFSGCTSLTSIIIPNSVTAIGDNAFSNCSSLMSITIPDSVTSIGYSAFSGCSGLSYIKIPDSVSSIEEDAFASCTGLTGVSISSALTSIDRGVFSGCTSLTSVDIPDSITSIESYAFCDCTSLKSISLGDSVWDISDGAFEGCSALTDVFFRCTEGDWVSGVGMSYFTVADYLGVDSINEHWLESPDYEFTVSGGTAIITDYNGSQVDVIIPSAIDGYTVTGIGFKAFAYCDDITSIVVPDTVTSIGSYAFYGCSNLKSITIPGSVTSIGENAFKDCDSLKRVLFQGAVDAWNSFDGADSVDTDNTTVHWQGVNNLYINDLSLYVYLYSDGHAEITKYTGTGGEVTIPDVIKGYIVTEISEKAFYECTNITSVTIGNSVEKIGYLAFARCTGLTSVNIPYSVTKIGGSAFSGCTGLTSVTIPDSITTIDSEVFRGCTGLTSVTIPNSVTEIGGSAFFECTGLTSVTIPDSVTTIKEKAFNCCTGLTSITIPDSVETLCGFGGCTGLTSVTIGNSVKYLNAFSHCYGLTSISIPNSVEYLGGFNGCTGLKSITIPNSVESLGNFSGCGLTSVTIPDSVTSIGDSAFRDCTGLTSASISNSVTKIGSRTFYRCSSLTSVTIGNSVTEIGYSAFCACNSLTRVSIGNSVTTIGDSAFYGCSGLRNVTIPDSVKRINENAFEDCTGLTSVDLGNSVQYINNDAFAYCTSLTSITIPDSVLYLSGSYGIGLTYPFRGCTGLTSVTIGSSNTFSSEPMMDVGAAFAECTGIKRVIIGNSVKSLYGTFCDCTTLESVSLGNSVTTLSGTFSNCHNIKEITIPDSVTRISGWAFKGCTGLKSITIPNSVEYLAGCFIGCTGLTSVKIGNSVTTIGDDAFYKCTGLTSIIIPNSVTKIGSSAFSGCTGLTSVTIPNSVTEIEEHAFYNCSGLKDVYYAGSEEEWHKIKFGYYNTDLTNATIHYGSAGPATPDPDGPDPDDPEEPYSPTAVSPMICNATAIDGIDMQFDSAWFFQSGQYYHHEIAQLSSQMILEGYIAGTDDEDREKGHRGVALDLETSLKSLGFKDKDIKIDLDTGRDQMNYFIASRKVTNGDDAATLVYVGCIGSYHQQWNSNFDPLGRDSNSPFADVDPKNHKGFDDAKNYIYTVIKDYIEKKNLSMSSTKILLTGHSRGAATANLVAAKLIDKQEYVYPSNLFTYTFATPNCTNNKNRNTSKYDGIFNIVFPTDFVTKVLPSAWGYGRYGTTYALPTKSNTKEYETKLKKKMMQKYRIINQATSGTQKFNDYILGEADVNTTVKVFTSAVKNFDDFYNQKYTWAGIVTYGSLGITPFKYFQEGLCPLVNKAGGEFFAGLKMLAPLLTCNSILYKTLSAFFLVDQGLSNRFMDAHKMETYCSFMLGLNSEEARFDSNGNKRKESKGSVNCPVDIEVIDKSTGEVVGRIVNNTVDEEIAAKENSVVMTVNGDEKEYWLPSDGNYDVRLIGNDNGVMDYTLSEVDSDLGETSRKNYLDVEVVKDKELVSTSSEETSGDGTVTTVFTLSDEGGEEVTPDQTFTSDEAIEYNIDVNIEGSGSAESLTITGGDYATLTATPYRSDFIGWYQDDTLISENVEYRFRPTESMNLTAKFTEAAPMLLGDVDGDDDISSVDATYIQRYCAEFTVSICDEYLMNGDVDDSEELEIVDATFIQRFLAEFNVAFPIGEPIAKT